MTALVSILLIAMIPIDLKLLIFPYPCMHCASGYVVVLSMWNRQQLHALIIMSIIQSFNQYNLFKKNVKNHYHINNGNHNCALMFMQQMP